MEIETTSNYFQKHSVQKPHHLGTYCSYKVPINPEYPFYVHPIVICSSRSNEIFNEIAPT